MSVQVLRFVAGAWWVGLLSVAHAQGARVWLDRMNEAVENLNYVGTFVHFSGGEAETLSVIHRNQDGQVSERLVSLDGVGREIIRQQDEVQCILPDRKVVLLDEGKDVSPLVSALPNYSEQLEANYEFKLFSPARVANRPTQVIGISPRDEFRYGYLLWLDQETAMPLRTKLWGENKQKIEEIFFTSIEFLDVIPDSMLDPTIDTEGFTLFRSGEGDDVVDYVADGIPWHVAALPQGFSLSVYRQRPMAGSQYPVEHLVYWDGLATVSVFIEDPNSVADVDEGLSSFGSTNAFSLTVGGRKVTAVGEVPPRTVRRIARSLHSK